MFIILENQNSIDIKDTHENLKPISHKQRRRSVYQKIHKPLKPILSVKNSVMAERDPD